MQTATTTTLLSLANAAEPGTGVEFHGVSFNPTMRSYRIFGLDDLDQELEDPAVFSWIDLQSPHIDALNELLRRWEIDLVLTSHFSESEILPRIVERPDCLAFYLYEIIDPEQHLDTARTLEAIDFGRMILILGGDFVITYHRRPLAATDDVKAGCSDAFRLAGETPGFIAFLFLERCVYDYAHLNLANDNFLDVIEEGLLAGGADEVGEGIAIAGRNILTLKKLAASLHIVLMLLATKRSPFISDEARESFHEMLQNATSVRSAIDSSRDMLDGILRSVQVAAANRTSEIAPTHRHLGDPAAAHVDHRNLWHEFRVHAGADVALWVLLRARRDCFDWTRAVPAVQTATLGGNEASATPQVSTVAIGTHSLPRRASFLMVPMIATAAQPAARNASRQSLA